MDQSREKQKDAPEASIGVFAQINQVHHPVLDRMVRHMEAWQRAGDNKYLFLSCYATMTSNMVQAITSGEFKDPAWVEKLMERFADYYFDALDRCVCGASDRPIVWDYTHKVTSQCELHVMQYLLLGINAHINYDLVLTLHEILDQEQARNTELLARRYEDHAKVNEIIADTVDIVQDQIIEKHAPMMEFIDKLLGRVDEYLLSSLITNWRDEVWNEAIRMLETQSSDQLERSRQALEDKVLRLAERIMLR